MVVGRVGVVTDARCAGWVQRPQGSDGDVALDVFLGDARILTASTDRELGAADKRPKDRANFMFEWPKDALQKFRQKVRVVRKSDGEALQGCPAPLISSRLPWLLWSARQRSWRVLVEGSAYRIVDNDNVDDLASLIPLTTEVGLDDEFATIGNASLVQRGESTQLVLEPDRQGERRTHRIDPADRLNGAMRWCRGHSVSSVWLASEAALEVECAAKVSLKLFLPKGDGAKPIHILVDGETVQSREVERAKPTDFDVTLPTAGRHRIGLLTTPERQDDGVSDYGFMLRGLNLVAAAA